jgi:ADP-heptose:LPS heptosyltransferase
MKRNKLNIENIIRYIIYGILKLFLKNERLIEKIEPYDIKNVLILRQDALGDMIVTLGMFKLIKKINPDIKVHVLASEKNHAIIQNDRYVDFIYIYKTNFLELISLIIELKRKKFDIIYCAYPLNATKNGLLVNFIGGKRAVKVIPRRNDKNWLFFNWLSDEAMKKDNMCDKMMCLLLIQLKQKSILMKSKLKL